MSKTLPIAVASFLAGAGLIYGAAHFCPCFSKSCKKVAVPTTYEEVVSQLDTHGHALVFMDPSLAKESVGVYFNAYKKIISNKIVKNNYTFTPGQQESIEQCFSLAKNIWEHSGLNTINGLGYSMIKPTTDSLQTKMVIQREEKGDAFLFDCFAAGNIPLVLQEMPADTSLLLAGGVDIPKLITDLEKIIVPNLPQETQEEYRNFLKEINRDGLAKISPDLSIENIQASLGATYALGLRINEQNQLPIMVQMFLGNETISIPDFRICIEVKNDLFFRLITEKIKGIPIENDLIKVEGNRLTITVGGQPYKEITIEMKGKLLVISSDGFSATDQAPRFLSRRDLLDKLSGVSFDNIQGISYYNEDMMNWFYQLSSLVNSNIAKTLSKEDVEYYKFAKELQNNMAKLHYANNLVIAQVNSKKYYGIAHCWGKFIPKKNKKNTP